MVVYKVASELNTKNQAFVIAFVVKSIGSSPGKTGFKMLIKSDGTSIGTIGGAKDPSWQNSKKSVPFHLCIAPLNT